MKISIPPGLLLAALVGTLLWCALVGKMHLAGEASLIDRFETFFLDARIKMIGTRVPPDAVAIVAIDNETAAELGRYPIGRGHLAQLVDIIKSRGARAVAIDMLLVGETDSIGDAALAASFSRFPAVIAGAARFVEGDGGRGRGYVPAPQDVLAPLPAFGAAAQIGLVNVVTDTGGTPRQMPLIYQFPHGPEPSFVLQAVSLYLGKMPGLAAEGLSFEGRGQALDFGWHLSLNYYGAGGTIRTISALDLLNGADVGGQLKDRIVLLGVTATGVGDRFMTPFDQILPGVEVLATGVSNLVDGSALVRTSSVRRIDIAAAVIITLIAISAMTVLPMAIASVAYAALLVCWFVVIAIAFKHYYWMSGILPIATSLPPLAAMGVLRQIFERVEMRKLASAQDSLGQFQSSVFAKRIAEDPTFLREPCEQRAAILFVDLAGYTGLTERLGPRRTRDVLKAFHTIVGHEVERQQGLILDFMGDGVMIGFGIADGHSRVAFDAVSTAFRLMTVIHNWIRVEGLGTELNGVRIGAHYGTVVVSRLGHENHQQIAATGDCVNLASRFLEVARSRMAVLAVSSDLIVAAGLEERLNLSGKRFDVITIRGRRETVNVALWAESDAALI